MVKNFNPGCIMKASHTFESAGITCHLVDVTLHLLAATSDLFLTKAFEKRIKGVDQGGKS